MLIFALLAVGQLVATLLAAIDGVPDDDLVVVA